MSQGDRSGRSTLLMEPPSAGGDSIRGVDLPASLAHFAPAIERSRDMTLLDDGWDGEGSLGYDEATWRRAVALAVRCASRYVSHRAERVPPPAIMKGPEGSIDILWRWGGRQLLIEVPADADEPATYHGYDRERRVPETQGTLDPADDNEWIVTWLSR